MFDGWHNRGVGDCLGNQCSRFGRRQIPVLRRSAALAALDVASRLGGQGISKEGIAGFTLCIRITSPTCLRLQALRSTQHGSCRHYTVVFYNLACLIPSISLFRLLTVAESQAADCCDLALIVPNYWAMLHMPHDFLDGWRNQKVALKSVVGNLLGIDVVVCRNRRPVGLDGLGMFWAIAIGKH